MILASGSAHRAAVGLLQSPLSSGKRGARGISPARCRGAGSRSPQPHRHGACAPAFRPTCSSSRPFPPRPYPPLLCRNRARYRMDVHGQAGHQKKSAELILSCAGLPVPVREQGIVALVAGLHGGKCRRARTGSLPFLCQPTRSGCALSPHSSGWPTGSITSMPET